MQQITLDNAIFAIFDHTVAALNHYCLFDDEDRQLIVDSLSDARINEVIDVVAGIIIYVDQMERVNANHQIDVDGVKDLGRRILERYEQKYES